MVYNCLDSIELSTTSLSRQTPANALPPQLAKGTSVSERLPFTSENMKNIVFEIVSYLCERIVTTDAIRVALPACEALLFEHWYELTYISMTQSA
jgi:hypothetical protein